MWLRNTIVGIPDWRGNLCTAPFPSLTNAFTMALNLQLLQWSCQCLRAGDCGYCSLVCNCGFWSRGFLKELTVWTLMTFPVYSTTIQEVTKQFDINWSWNFQYFCKYINNTQDLSWHKKNAYKSTFEIVWTQIPKSRISDSPILILWVVVSFFTL